MIYKLAVKATEYLMENEVNNDKHRMYWNMSNSEDSICKDCAERLMCINCKAYKIIYTDKTTICRSKV